MDSAQFVKVFDVLDAGYEAWFFPAFGLIFVAIGLVLLIGPAVLRRLGIPFLQDRSWKGRFVGYFFVIFATLWTGTAFYATYTQHRRNTTMAEQNRCRVVEGQVKHFVPMPYGGHAFESFSVRGTPFRYSDFNITGGFNNTASHGGPITPDAYVRICYDPSNNLILRLEIRGFNGTMPKRSGVWLFPQPPAQPTPSDLPLHPTWLGLPIVAIGLLDLFALITLSRPYLRTFPRIGGIADRFTLRPDLEPEKAIKLSQCLIYWDRPEHAIWLRPRGLVLFQVPLMVAKINIDSDDRTVIGWDVRLSWGSVAIVAITVASFFWFLFAMMAAGKGPPAAVLVAFGVFAIVIAGANIRMLRSRMINLMDGALPELGA